MASDSVAARFLAASDQFVQARRSGLVLHWPIAGICLWACFISIGCHSTANRQSPIRWLSENDSVIVAAGNTPPDLAARSESPKNLIATVNYLENEVGDRPVFEMDDPIPATPNASPESNQDAESNQTRETNQDKSEALTNQGGNLNRDAELDQDFDFPRESKLALDAVLDSTLNFYPEIEATLQELVIADGNWVGTQGSFDTKLKASNESTPVGFYETYRSQFGVERPTFNGGSVFAGYRFGRGDFAPWYLERNTNAGGELKLGASWSILRGRKIDARRVALWQADLKRDAVQPVVRQQLLRVFLDAELAYWNWVAAGQIYRRTRQLYQVAKNRVGGLEARIQAGDLAEIARTDNQRTLLSREVKLIKAEAKLNQSAIKLSLFLRDDAGQPIAPIAQQLPIAERNRYDVANEPSRLVADAIRCRPEIRLIDLDVRNVDLDLTKAQNDLLPQLNASVSVSQDFGDPTSASAAASSSTQELFVFFDEKDEFQVDTGIFWSQSLQRRKARGKIQALQGKRRQLQIKRGFLQQKIEADVMQNYQLTVAAREQIEVAEKTLELARKLSDVARQQIETGDKDLFEIILREQQELDAAIELIASQFNFYSSRARLNNAIGCDQDQFYQRVISR